MDVVMVTVAVVVWVVGVVVAVVILGLGNATFVVVF